jgi:UDP-N-acetylmuramate--L-alanine ligase
VDLRRDNELIDDKILNAEAFNKKFFDGAIFGFDANGREIAPEALQGYDAASRAQAMLALYNFNVNADYRISPANLKGASQFRAAFLNFIASELKRGALKIYRFKPAVKFCVADNAIIFSYLCGMPLPVFVAKPAYKLTRAILSLRSGLLLNGDDAFRNFVFCKIALRNAGAQLQLVGKSGELIVVRKSGFSLGVVTSFKKNLPQNPAIYDNDIKKALELCRGANLDAVYLVYPKNENFNRHVEIKSECFKGNFIMKLVPYKLTDKIY